LEDKRQVSHEEGQRIADYLDVMFAEASAKTGFNVQKLFKRTVAALPSIREEEVLNRDIMGITMDTTYQMIAPKSNCPC